MRTLSHIALGFVVILVPSVVRSDPQRKPGGFLDGVRYEFPCKGKSPTKSGAACASALGADPKADQFTIEKKFGGEPGKRYKVTLRFRGVVEPMMYKDGTPSETDPFYAGGAPDHPEYSVYKLTISSPPAHFYLNRKPELDHQVFLIDYVKTLEIDGGATVTFHGDGQNGRLISNAKKLVVPGIPPAPKPFNGQFVQVNVVEVK